MKMIGLKAFDSNGANGVIWKQFLTGTSCHSPFLHFIALSVLLNVPAHVSQFEGNRKKKKENWNPKGINDPFFSPISSLAQRKHTHFIKSKKGIKSHTLSFLICWPLLFLCFYCCFGTPVTSLSKESKDL